MKNLHLFITMVLIITMTTIVFGLDHPRVLIDNGDIQIIKNRLANPENVLLRNFYDLWRDKVENDWSTHTYPHYLSYSYTNQLFYPIYSDVAFMALLEDDPNVANSWKDNMISVALQFYTVFNQSGLNLSQQLFRADFFTIATALIYDYCYDRLDPSEKASMISMIETGMNFTRPYVLNPENAYNHEYSNFHTRVPAGYIIGGIAIAEDSPTYDLDDLNEDLDIIKDNLIFQENPMFKYMFGDNGAYEEGSGYFGINLGRSFLSLIALSKYDGTDYFHNTIVEATLGNASKWLITDLLPNRTPKYFVFNALTQTGNGATISAITNLLVIAQKYNDRFARWLFNEALGSMNNIFYDGNHIFPEVFIPTLIIYENIESLAPDLEGFNPFVDYQRGLVNIRTGWGQNDLLFSIEANPARNNAIVPSRQNQFDKGNITITRYGINFIYDSMVLGRETEDNNYICIDGHGQSRGNDGPVTNSGKISAFQDYNFLDLIEVKTKNAFDSLYLPTTNGLFAWGPSDIIPTQYGMHFPVQEGLRTILHLSSYGELIPDYFWVIDELKEDNEASDYDWHIFTDWYNTITTTTNPITISRSGRLGKLDIFMMYPINYNTVVSDYYPDTEIDELIVNTTIEDLTTKKLQIRQNSVSGHYYILLVPYDTSLPNHSHTYTILSMTSGYGTKVIWNSGYTDYCLFSSSSALQAGFLNTDSRHIFLRKNTSTMKFDHYYVRDGSYLDFEGPEIVNLFGSRADVICEKDIVKIYGENINNLVVYAPYANSLLVNDISIPYTRNGDYIQADQLFLLASQNKSTSNTATFSNNARHLVKAGGKLHEIFVSGGEIFYRRSPDNGISWEITQRLSNGSGNYRFQCITASSSNMLH